MRRIKEKRARKKENFVKANDSGFTILEVLVAVAIFSIGILAIAGLQYIVIAGNSGANVVTHEVMLAQRILEEVKNIPDATLLSGSAFDLNNVDEKGEANGPYNVDVMVLVPPSGQDVSRFVSVTVTKSGPNGHPVTVNSLTHGNGI